MGVERVAKEILDIFDEEMNHLGTAARSEVHQKGYWHQTFHCWIISRDAGRLYILFQRRHPQKDTFPDKLDITCAGHLLAGEQPADGVRELVEELGVTVPFSSLRSIGIIKDVTVSDDKTDKEFCHTFLLETNRPLTAYTLQAEELTEIVKMELEQAIRLFNGEIGSAFVSGIRLHDGGSKEDVRYEVNVDSFVPHDPAYYETVFRAAKAMDGGR
jgi:isopentenyldiphosphate isomerase